MDFRAFSTYLERNKAVADSKQVSLKTISEIFKDDVSNVHCENLIGGVSVPMGVAGPFSIKGSIAEGEYIVPLATSEGALVASVSRGMKAINESGGAFAHIERAGTTRGPVFKVNSLQKAVQSVKWINANIGILQEAVTKTSSHIGLMDIQTRNSGVYLFLRCIYDTDEAMGMNMVTIATQHLVGIIEKECGIDCVSVAGNYDIDKKPAWLNSIEGRGMTGWAEATISSQVLSRILKTDASTLYSVWVSKCMVGSAMAGSIGFNAHYANIIAALFLATGQDLAHVVEGSLGITTMIVEPNDSIRITVYLPAIMVGNIGGGTKLKTQTEARSIIGAQSVVELAEVIVATVLAGELSLLSSLAEGTLASAHKQLGR